MSLSYFAPGVSELELLEPPLARLRTDGARWGEAWAEYDLTFQVAVMKDLSGDLRGLPRDAWLGFPALRVGGLVGSNADPDDIVLRILSVEARCLGDPGAVAVAVVQPDGSTSFNLLGLTQATPAKVVRRLNNARGLLQEFVQRGRPPLGRESPEMQTAARAIEMKRQHPEWSWPKITRLLLTPPRGEIKDMTRRLSDWVGIYLERFGTGI
jgi:hypothetical protein